MAPNREDRRLERQRGAGTRQVKNTGFDLVLPGQENVANPLLEPRKSGRRKTPQPELRPQQSTRRTPAPEELLPQRSTRRTPALELIPQLSSRRTPATGVRRKRGRPAEDAISEIEETAEAVGPIRGQGDGVDTATKRRKFNKAVEATKDAEDVPGTTDPELQVQDSQTLEPDRGTSPKGPVKKRKKRKSIGQQSMKAKPNKTQTPPEPVQKAPQKRAPKPKRTTPIEPSREELRVQAQVHGLPFGGEKHPSAPEVTEARDFAAEVPDPDPGPKNDSKRVKPTSKKRKRVSIGQQSMKRTKPTSAKPTEDIVPQGGLAVAEHMTDASQSQDEAAEDAADAANDAIETQDIVLENPEIRIAQKVKRKKRKSIGQQRPKRKSTESASVSSSVRKDAPSAGASGLSNTKKVATNFNSGAASGRQPIDEDTQIEVESVSEAAEAPAVVPKFPKKQSRSKKDAPHQAPPQTKAPKAPQRRKMDPKPSSKPTKPKSATPQPRVPPKNTIPITIYGPPSPASSNPEQSDVEDDPLSTTQTLPPTKTINPVDVLSQICREMIHKTSTSLTEKSHEDPTRRAEFRQKKRTVESYGEELNSRLLQLTKALNTNTALTTRLRDATREAKRLKKDIKAVEEERERVKLRKQEVLKAKKAKELEDMLSGIAGAVKRGWEMQARQDRGRSVPTI